MPVKKPRRRQFHHTLPTMLVLVTLVCAYLAWAMNWKRQREAFLERNDVVPIMRYRQAYPTHAPLALRLVGETGVYVIGLRSPTKEEAEEAERLFPESQIGFDGGSTHWRAYEGGG